MAELTSLNIRFNKEDTAIEAGIDEAGRGCFWGPIMAGAVIWSNESEWTDEHKKIIPQIKDSKKISPKKRAIIAAKIKEIAKAWSVGTVHASEIDKNGITWANQEAFRRAVQGLSVKPDRLLIDGELVITDPEPECEQHNIVDGDANYLIISAASILAKVTHDEWVENYCKLHTDIADKYGLTSCKGYGTQKHRQGLQTYGSTEEHRQSFIWRWVGDGTPFVHSDTSFTSKKSNGYRKGNNKCLIQL
jgi:ribonuclease HII